MIIELVIELVYVDVHPWFCRLTVELVRRAEQCGVSWITVHGRTPKQRAEPASMEAIKLVCPDYIATVRNITLFFLLNR